MTKEQKIEQTIEEEVKNYINKHIASTGFVSELITDKQVQQIISLVRADERERILDEIESKEYLTAEDMQFIYKLLRPESDTEGKG